MSNPIKPKNAKPKANVPENSNGDLEMNGVKLIIINTVITLLICAIFVGANYFIVSSSVEKVIAHQPHVEEEHIDDNAEPEAEHVEHGLILDLGEFILNLSDPNARRYLKVNVAVELTKKDSDPNPHEEEEAGGHGGGHGGGGADPMEAIKAEMDQYRPAVRDAIISILSSKTPEELASITGKEFAKEQIKESVDSIFASQREVIRVSFGTFIIQ